MSMYLRRRAQFSAGFMQPPSGETGRGHDYRVEVTVGGLIDPQTGMVINIKDVDAVLQARVVSILNGTLLDRDVPTFQDMPPTPENIVRFLWDTCAPSLPSEGRLARVTLWPANTLAAELSLLSPDGMERERPMLTVTRAYDFSASHRLHSPQLTDEQNEDIFGKCNRVNGHGHNYEVEVTLAGEPDPRTGRLLSLETLDRIVDEEVLTPYDHRHLNYDVPAFRDLNPTSENLTRVIWDNLSRRLSRAEIRGARLHKVAVRETARNYFEYYGD